MIKKAISVFLFAVLSVSQLVFPLAVMADGMLIIRPDPYVSRWDFSPETNQQAFINYEDGLQKMIISIGIEEQAKKGAVWLFPVPSAPERVSIDVLTAVPDLSGEEVRQKAEMILNDLKGLSASTQIYPFFFYALDDMVLTGALVSDGDGFGGGTWDNGIEVYEHIEKEGMVSEVITAKSAEGLYNYLKDKGLNIDAGSIPVLDNYIGKDFSFVVSWIGSPTISQDDPLTAESIKQNLYKYITEKDTYWRFSDYYDDYIVKPIKNHVSASIFEAFDWNDLKDAVNDPVRAAKYFTSSETKYGKEYLNKIIQAIQEDPSLINQRSKKETAADQKGVYVIFPTEKIYFPLIPTSVYGDRVVPASIRVLGHVSPKIYEGIKANTKVKYYDLDYLTKDDQLKDFFGERTVGCGFEGKISFSRCSINYTKIDISAPSASFTEDLWMNDVPPMKVVLPNFVIEQKLLLGFLMLAIISVLTGILSGWAVFKEHRNLKGIKKFGLLGLFNIFTIISLWIVMNFTRTKEGMKEAETAIMEVKRKKYYNKIIAGSFLRYLCLPFLVLVILMAPVLLMFLVSLATGRLSDMSLFIPVFLAVLSAALIASWRLKKVKKEDQPLFDWLKYCKYSTSTFVPEDGRKIGFVFFYSVSFLVISWIVFRMLIIAVNI